MVAIIRPLIIKALNFQTRKSRTPKNQQCNKSLEISPKKAQTHMSYHYSQAWS